MAEDLPPSQLLYHTKEVSSMMVSCTKTSPTQADCDFIQLSVRKNTTKEDLKNRLAKIDGLMKAPIKKQDCDQFAAVVDSIRSGKAVGGAKPEMLAQFLKDKDRAREVLKGMEPAVTFCRNPTVENARKFIETGHDMEMRTCYVSGNPFKQSFTLNLYSGRWEHLMRCDFIKFGVL